jgi:prepilin-type N-terminal cleavage/methylation domain-containing protein
MQWFVINLLLRACDLHRRCVATAVVILDWRDTRGGQSQHRATDALFCVSFQLGKHKSELPDIGFQTDTFVELAVVARLRTAPSNFPRRLRLFDIMAYRRAPPFEGAEWKRPRNATERVRCLVCLAGVNLAKHDVKQNGFSLIELLIVVAIILSSRRS